MKKIIVLLLVAVMAFGCFACAQPAGTGEAAPKSDAGSAEAGAPAAAASKDTLTIGIVTDPGMLDIQTTDSLMIKEIANICTNSLFDTNDKAEVVPCLAESYQNIDDLTWEFKLHEGVVFHDGSTLDAQDVIASFERLGSLAGAKYVNNIDKVEAIDELNIRIVTKKPDAGLPVKLSYENCCIYPSEKIAEGHDFTQAPIATGPYKFVSYASNEEIVFEANENYWGEPKPSIKNLVLKIIPEASSRTIALQAGEIDLNYAVSSADLSTLEADENIEIGYFDAASVYCLFMNNERWPFTNELVRKGINSAINRDDVIAVAANGIGNPAFGALPDTYKEATNESAMSFDLEAAKKYLAESGEDLSGWTFEIYCKDEQHAKMAQVIQANLLEVGINVSVITEENAVIMPKMCGGEIDSYITSYATADAYEYLYNMFGIAAIGSTNLSRVNIPEVTDLLSQAASCFDPEKRSELLKQVVVILNDNCTRVPLYSEVLIKAYNKDLGGVLCSPNKWQNYASYYWEA